MSLPAGLGLDLLVLMRGHTQNSNRNAVVLLTHEFAPFHGGVAVYTEELAAALQRAGVEVEVWCPKYPQPSSDADRPFSVVRLDGGYNLHWGPMLQFGRELLGRQRQLEQRTLMATSVGAHMVLMVLQLFGVFRTAKVGSLLHGSEPLRFQRNPLWRFLAGQFFLRVDLVLTCSSYSRSVVAGSFLGSRIRHMTVAPCACSTAATRMTSPVMSRDGKIRILTLARVHPRKGQLEMARALSQMPAALRSRIIYQIGGTGDVAYLAEVQKTCRNAQVECQWLGEIAEEALAATYAQCDIHAMTSRSLSNSVEGFGIAYLEAGFHGKPSVAFHTGGVAEAVLDNETGLLVDEGDLPALTSALEKLIVQPDLRQRLGDGARRHARQFSWDKTAQIVREQLVAPK